VALNLEYAKIKCSICEVEIPWPEFAKHIAMHQQQFDVEQTTQEMISVPESWEYQMKKEAQVSSRRTIEISPSLMRNEQPKRERFEKPKILRRLKL